MSLLRSNTICSSAALRLRHLCSSLSIIISHTSENGCFSSNSPSLNLASRLLYSALSISSSDTSPLLNASSTAASTTSSLSVITSVPFFIARAIVSACDSLYLWNVTFCEKSPPSVTTKPSPHLSLRTFCISGFITAGTPESSLYAAITEYAPPLVIGRSNAA